MVPRCWFRRSQVQQPVRTSSIIHELVFSSTLNVHHSKCLFFNLAITRALGPELARRPTELGPPHTAPSNYRKRWARQPALLSIWTNHPIPRGSTWIKVDQYVLTCYNNLFFFIFVLNFNNNWTSVSNILEYDLVNIMNMSEIIHEDVVTKVKNCVHLALTIYLINLIQVFESASVIVL